MTCGRSSGVERLLPKQNVVGSIPIARSNKINYLRRFGKLDFCLAPRQPLTKTVSTTSAGRFSDVLCMAPLQDFNMRQQAAAQRLGASITGRVVRSTNAGTL